MTIPINMRIIPISIRVGQGPTAGMLIYTPLPEGTVLSEELRSKGEEVKNVQNFLIHMGYKLGWVGGILYMYEYGTYDAATASQVLQFQKDFRFARYGKDEDGKWGPQCDEAATFIAEAVMRAEPSGTMVQVLEAIKAGKTTWLATYWKEIEDIAQGGTGDIVDAKAACLAKGGTWDEAATYCTLPVAKPIITIPWLPIGIGAGALILIIIILATTRRKYEQPAY